MSKFEVLDLKRQQKSKKDIHASFRSFDEPESLISSSMRRAPGTFELKDNVIAKVAESLIITLGAAKGFLLQDLFADKAVYAIKMDQLTRLGSTEARLKDAQGSVFWARLSLKGKGVFLEDIDIEKNFELDCEDLMEEQERVMCFTQELPAFQ